jgi:DNA-binding GntR family transcriptional regulator
MPGCTTYVEDLTAEDIQEVWLMRLTLEPVAAALAAAHPQPELILRLYRLADRMAEERERGCLEACAECDLEFHRSVVQATCSPRLIRAYDLSHVPMVMSRLPSHHISAEALRLKHCEYTLMIERSDIVGARRIALEHVDLIPGRMSAKNLAELRTAVGILEAGK